MSISCCNVLKMIFKTVPLMTLQSKYTLTIQFGTTLLMVDSVNVSTFFDQ